MLTSKARAELRARTHDLDLIVTVGKSGITDNLIRETDLALQARELIKCQVLESALLSAREASDALCAATGADGVQVIGNKFVLYRKSEKRQAAPKKKTETRCGVACSSGAKRRASCGRSGTPTLSRLPSRPPSSGRRKSSAGSRLKF